MPDSPSASPEARVERLTAAARRRVIEPDLELTGRIGDGQLIGDALLSTAGLGLDLSDADRATLSREEIASIAAAGIRFEAVLEAAFAAHIATAHDLLDARITFVLHEIGEETRHQRLFQRLVAQLRPAARLPVPYRLLRLGYRAAVEMSIANPAFFYVLVLAGEEIPDLFQKIAADDPDTDAFVRDVNRYHRLEEARHLSFARAVLPETFAAARRHDRWLVRHLAPHVIRFMFASMVHPGVYAVIGLPPITTWLRANRSADRRLLRFAATRPILDVLTRRSAADRCAPACVGEPVRCPTTGRAGPLLTGLARPARYDPHFGHGRSDPPPRRRPRTGTGRLVPPELPRPSDGPRPVRLRPQPRGRLGGGGVRGT